MVTFRLQEPDWVAGMVKHFPFTMVGVGFGGTEPIVSLPELHCHAALTQTERDAREIGSDVVRVSVGLENPDDIIEEFVESIRQSH